MPCGMQVGPACKGPQLWMSVSMCFFKYSIPGRLCTIKGYLREHPSIYPLISIHLSIYQLIYLSSHRTVHIYPPIHLLNIPSSHSLTHLTTCISILPSMLPIHSPTHSAFIHSFVHIIVAVCLLCARQWSGVRHTR